MFSSVFSLFYQIFACPPWAARVLCLLLQNRYRTYNTWWRTRWGATSGASLGFPRMDFPTRFLQMFLNCQVQVFLNCQVQMFVLLELLGLFYRQADAKTQCWMQQINIENTQQVGKWIFRKMAKSALAFYKRCKMDLLKSRTKLCGFQALLRYEDDSCNEFEEKKSMRQNYGQSIAPLWRQTKSVHKETEIFLK